MAGLTAGGMVRKGTGAILILLLAAGCGEGPDATGDAPLEEAVAPEFEVRDSAGVRIVTYTSLGAGAPSPWQADMSAAVRIGRFGHAPEDSSHVIGMPMGVTRLTDGRVAILDRQGMEIRVFDADGTFSEVVGGPGEGPLEFQQPIGLFQYRGDSLLVSEYRGRLHVFDGALSGGRTFRFEVKDWAGVTWPEVHGAFPDGSVLVITRNERDRITTLHHVGPTGEDAHAIATYPTSRIHMLTPISEGPPFVAVSGTRSPTYLISDAHLYLSNRGLWEVRRYSEDGSLEQIVRFDRDALESRLDPPFAGRYEVRPSLEDTLRMIRDSVGLSPVRVFEVDRAGNLWLRAQSDRSDDVGAMATWYVLDGDGVPMGTARLPHPWNGGSRIEIGTDYVVALERDEFEVSTAVLAPLVKR